MDSQSGAESGDEIFAFMITPRKNAEHGVVNYEVVSRRSGIALEAVITVTRNWLQSVEEEYPQEFVGKK